MRSGFQPLAIAALSLLISALGLVGPAAAQFVFFSADNTSSDNLSAGFGTSFDRISDLSGLSETPILPSNFDTITHSTPFSASTKVLAGGTSGNFIFDFNEPQAIDDILVWNYFQTSVFDRGVNEFNIQVDTGSGLTQVATGNLAVVDPADHVAQIVDIPDQTGVTQLVLTAVSNHGSTFVGLDEVVFRLAPGGDINGDGAVNALDFDILTQNMFTDVDPQSPDTPREQGDLNDDGKIDLLDYRIYKDDPELVFTPPPASALEARVPEPTSLVLLILGGLSASGCRVSRSFRVR